MLFGEWDYATAIEVAKEEGEEKGIKKGIEKGIEKGVEQGIQIGEKQGESKLTARLLSAKEMLQKGISRNEVQKKLNLDSQLMQLL